MTGNLRAAGAEVTLGDVGGYAPISSANVTLNGAVTGDMAMLIITGVAIFAGYALGSYVLGVGLWLGAGRPMPGRLLGKFGLTCLGAFVAGLAWAVPVAGWFFVLGLTLLGIGTLAAFVVPNAWQLQREPSVG